MCSLDNAQVILNFFLLASKMFEYVHVQDNSKVNTSIDGEQDYEPQPQDYEPQAFDMKALQEKSTGRKR